MAKSAVNTRHGKRNSNAVNKPKPRSKTSRTTRKVSAHKFMLTGGQPSSEPPIIVAEGLPPSMRLPSQRKGASEKPATKPRTRKRSANSKQELTHAVAAPSATTEELAPLSRAMAPVIWKKSGPIGQLLKWVRSGGRNITQMLNLSRAGQPHVQRPTGIKLRTKTDLLRELAVLRQENAIMRDRLGLPKMAFGRQIIDNI